MLDINRGKENRSENRQIALVNKISTKRTTINDNANKIQDSSIPILFCEKNQDPLWIGFGCVDINSETLRKFRLSNTSFTENANILIDEIPASKGFSISFELNQCDNILIPPGGYVDGTISWFPTVDMIVNNVMNLRLNDKDKIYITLHGIAGRGEDYNLREQDHGRGSLLPKGKTTSRMSVCSSKSTNKSSKINSRPSESGVRSSTSSSSFASNRISLDIPRKTDTSSFAGNKDKVRAGKLATINPSSTQSSQHWINKQVVGVVNWMNQKFSQATVTQPINLNTENTIITSCEVNSQSLIRQDSGLRFLLESQINNEIYKKGRHILESCEMRSMIEAITDEADSGRLAIRTDRDIQTDVALKEAFINLILSYELPWLAYAALLLFGVVCPTTEHQNKKLRNFIKKLIIEHLLYDPSVIEEYASKTVKSTAQTQKMKAAFRVQTIRNFFRLVFLLDQSRCQNILASTPKLLIKESSHKSSRDIITAFARDFLQKEGDVMKHLLLIGCTVQYEQTFIDEFEFRIENFREDLRDGVRLTRLLEVLTNKYGISASLRVPAVSRLQKIFNIGLVVRLLEDAGLTNVMDTKAVVEGKLASTLLVVWRILYHFELKKLICCDRISQEVMAIRSSRTWRRSRYAQLEAIDLAVAVPILHEDGTVTYPESSSNSLSTFSFDDNDESSEIDREKLKLSDEEEKLRSCLISWCDVIATPYGVIVDNLTRSLADGRALCLLIHHYHPTVLPTRLIKKTTVNIKTSDRGGNAEESISRADTHQAIEGEHRNFSLLRTACESIGGIPITLPIYDSESLPDERTMMIFLGFLFSRLIDTSHQVRAAIRIQRFYRKKKSIFVKKPIKKKFRKSKHIQVTVVGGNISGENKQQWDESYLDTTQSLESSLINDSTLLDNNFKETNGGSHLPNEVISTILPSTEFEFTKQLEEARKAAELESQRRIDEVTSLAAQEAYLRAQEVREVAEREMAAEREARLAAEARLERLQEEARRVAQEKLESVLLAEEARRVAQEEEAVKQRVQEELRRVTAEKEALRVSAVNALLAKEEEEARALLKVEAARLHEEESRRSMAELAARMKSEAENEMTKQLEEARKAAELESQRRIDEVTSLAAQEAYLRAQEVREVAEREMAAEREARLAAEARLECLQEEARRVAQEKLESVLLAEEARRVAQEEDAVKQRVQEELRRVTAEKEALRVSAENALLAKEEEEARALLKVEAIFNEKQRVEQAAKELLLMETTTRNSLQLVIDEERTARAKIEEELSRETKSRKEMEARLLVIDLQLQSQAEVEAMRQKKEQQKVESQRQLAAILLQSQFRKAIVRSQISRIKSSIIIIQARVKGLLVKRRCRREVVCAMKLQQCWRKHAQYVAIQKLAHSQSEVRSNRILAQNNLHRNNAAIIIQKLFKKNMQHKAATFLQACIRRHLAKMNIQKRRHSCSQIQRIWRNYQATKLSAIHAKQVLVMKINAKTIIWRSWQEYRNKKREAAARRSVERWLKKLNATRKIERWMAAYRPLMRARKLIAGFGRLQALYRARKIRAKSPVDVILACRRIQVAWSHARSNPGLRLGKQTSHSLEILQNGKMISQVHKACQTLLFSTKYSSRCCKAFAEAGASTILFELIRSCNRSTPHQELLRIALDVLLNVAKYDYLAPAVAKGQYATDTLIDLMQMFRDKKHIFCEACELLYLLATASTTIKDECNSAEFRKRLDGILHIMERKQRLDVRVKTISLKSTTVGKAVTEPGSLSSVVEQPVNLVQRLMKTLQ